MASMMDKVRQYMRSPQGKQTMEKGKQMARDPRTRRKARDLFDRLRGRGTRNHQR